MQDTNTTPQPSTQSTRKLHLGCGYRVLPGYFNIDVEPRDGVYAADFRTLTFTNVEEIRAHHLLEHFDRNEGEKVLTQWHSWLQKGGTLIVETPDFEGICANFKKDPYWMARHAYGSQQADWAYHKDAWYEEKFRTLLPKLGFEIQEVRHSVSRKILPNITVIAKKL